MNPAGFCVAIFPSLAETGREKNMNKYHLTLYSYCAIYVPVHPGRGPGHDGGFDGVDVAPAGLVKRSSGTRELEGRPVDTTVHAL